MINPHNPYPLIMQELFNRNEIYEETRIRALKATQTYVIDLRRSYRNTPCNVNYEDRFLRAAYMLAYFPYYIETVHRVLDGLPNYHLPRYIFDNNMNICFYGAGPAPELLGFLSYLELHRNSVQRINSYLFDAATQWETCRDICANYMAPVYWRGIVDINPIRCNMLECFTCEHNLCDEVIPTARFHIMQNCLNDMVGNPVGIINAFRKLFIKLTLGSIFIIIDLNYLGVRDLLNVIEQDIVSKHLGIAIKPVCTENEWYKPGFDIPQELIDHIFDNGPETIPKKYTKYYSLVLRRC